jgi:hypothetical protein
VIVPNFRHRLTRVQQRIYDRSNAVNAVPLHATARLRAAVAALPEALLSADATRVARISQAVADEITTNLQVPQVRVVVERTRPSNARGELHGLYTSARGKRSAPNLATVKLWMITAKRGKVVAFKTFLRTLLHEICHHLDYALLGLPDSFHTDGFYKRESSLFYRIGGPAAASPSARQAEPQAAAASEPRPVAPRQGSLVE